MDELFSCWFTLLSLGSHSSVDSQKLPGVHEVMFYNETEDSPGVMMWRYPEPRILTFVRITPVPFNTTEDPEISTADLGDVLQVSIVASASDALVPMYTFVQYIYIYF